MTFQLSPASFTIHKRVVVGPFDTSAAGLLLLHPKAWDGAATATVTSDTPLDFHLAFGVDGHPIHLFNDSETTYISLNISNLNDTSSSLLASALSLFLSDKEVEQIFVPVALQYQFKTKKICVHDLWTKTEGRKQFPSDAPINDAFVAQFVNFLRLEEIPTTLLITRGYKFSAGKPSQTKEVIQTLGEALKEQLPSFTWDASSFSKLKPNPAALSIETNESLMYL